MALTRFLLALTAVVLVSAEPPSPYHYNKPVANPTINHVQTVPSHKPSSFYGAPISHHPAPQPPIYHPPAPQPPVYHPPAPQPPVYHPPAPQPPVYHPPAPQPPVYHPPAPQPPKTSYGVPSHPIAPPVHIPSPSHQLPSLPELPQIPDVIESRPIQAISIKPSLEYGAPHNLAAEGTHNIGIASGSSSGSFISVGNSLGSGGLDGNFDPELKSVVENILLKEESRAFAEESQGGFEKIVAISMDGPAVPAIDVANFVLSGRESAPAPLHIPEPIHIPAPVYGPAH